MNRDKIGNHIEMHPIKGFTKIDYTLEQALAELKLNHDIQHTLEKIVRTMDKISKVQKKQQDLAILFDHRIIKLEKILKKNHGGR